MEIGQENFYTIRLTDFSYQYAYIYLTLLGYYMVFYRIIVYLDIFHLRTTEL